MTQPIHNPINDEPTSAIINPRQSFHDIRVHGIPEEMQEVAGAVMNAPTIHPGMSVEEMRAEQFKAWEAFRRDHPIAARKARQQALYEQRKAMTVSLNFGSVKLPGRV